MGVRRPTAPRADRESDDVSPARPSRSGKLRPHEALIDVPLGSKIDSLRASSEGRVSIIIARRSIGTLTVAAVDELGLRAGLEWTPGLASRLAKAFEEDEARQAALRLLAVRPRSRGELLNRLKQKRIRPALAEALIAEFEAKGMIDDRAFAALYARSVARKPVGARLVEQKLREKRVAGPLAASAAREALEGRDALAEATDLARRKLAAMPAKLDAPARMRRLIGLLARRGFDGEVSREAVRRALPSMARATMFE